MVMADVMANLHHAEVGCSSRVSQAETQIGHADMFHELSEALEE